MPRNDELGEARRSHCLGNLSPGSVAEFRVSDGSSSSAISAVICGLDQWQRAVQGTPMDDQRTNERRLEKHLNVTFFRLPPVDPQDRPGHHARGAYLKAVRFPYWLVCPACNSLKRERDWDSARTVGDVRKRCASCSASKNHDVFVAPARFIVACRRGHLQEFPWDRWVGHRTACSRSDLQLGQTSKAGLAGLVLSCRSCGANRPMEGALGENTLRELGVGCDGRRPWISLRKEHAEAGCEEVPRALQRGASNLHFPCTVSALSIPPFTAQIQVLLGDYWHKFIKLDESKWPELIELLSLEEDLGIKAADIIAQIRVAKRALDASSVQTIRWEEYEQIRAGGHRETDFETREEAVPASLSPFLSRIVRVVRLREVRAMTGFTRIEPPAGAFGASGDEESDPRYAKISASKMAWLPAAEVRGEGIFIELSGEAIARWQASNASTLAKRVGRINEALLRRTKPDKQGSKAHARRIDARFLLVHSLSHALIRELTVASGYSSASLKERLYVGEGDHEMAGLLIYTATSDADGSLGGLERQGKSTRLETLIRRAVRSCEWCSNDPLCIKDISTFTDPLNLSACHSCMMLPETSCEEFNSLLDRATLVGLPDCPEYGFFRQLLSPLSEL